MKRKSKLNHLPEQDVSTTLKSTSFGTKLGTMLAIADQDFLYLLEFCDYRGLENEVESLRKKLNAVVMPGKTEIIKNVQSEINDYFLKKNKLFNIPIQLQGTPFQKKVWKELSKIPFGETRSYLDIAKAIKQPTAFRAVAQANGANPLAIIIPCHRVINHNGQLGGYGGGIARKEWLLKHEKQLNI